MKGTFYPDLVKVFYTTTHIDREIGFLCEKVKGKSIVMAPELWKDIDGLPNEGMIANEKGLKDVGVKFNKVSTHQSLAKNPSSF